MKNKRLLTFAFWGIAICMFGQSVPSMLSSNSEWSYYVRKDIMDEKGYYVSSYPSFYHFYIKGTEEINGKDYHCVWCEWSIRPEWYLRDETEQPVLIAHFREENNRIVAPFCDYDVYNLFFYGDRIADEGIIYDWNWEGRVSLQDILFVFKQNEKFVGMDGLSRTLWEDAGGRIIIEGIGAIEEFGMLTHWMTSYPISMNSDLTTHLNVFVQNGKVVYKAPDYTGDPEKQDEDYTTYKPDPYLGELVEASFVSSTIIPASSPTYDLSGRKTSSPTARGIYIEDGKKVVR